MIVNSERAIALTCPACQVIQEHPFSLFTISRQPLQLLCRCGFSQGHLRKLKRNYELDVLGVDGDRVRLLLSRNELIRTPLRNIFSTKNGQELGYIGSPEAVQEAIVTGSRDFVAESGDFANPQIMREILAMLQDLAEQHKIRCECEHPSVGIDIYADKVELVCAFCGSMVVIGASTHKHQERLSRVSEIIMEPCTAQYLEEWLKPLT